MGRQLTPEILDSLPSDSPEAIASRRDLRIINACMRTRAWFERSIGQLDSDLRCLEIGAGDGSLAEALSQHPNISRYAALDRISRPANLPASVDWIQADLFDESVYDGVDLVIANLILHHFEDGELSTLGQILNKSSVKTLLAAEPIRRQLHKYQLHAGRLIGFSRITLHDATVSIEAGFQGNELATTLGFADSDWHWSIRETWIGSHRMVAKRL